VRDASVRAVTVRVRAMRVRAMRVRTMRVRTVSVKAITIRAGNPHRRFSRDADINLPPTDILVRVTTHPSNRVCQLIILWAICASMEHDIIDRFTRWSTTGSIGDADADWRMCNDRGLINISVVPHITAEPIICLEEPILRVRARCDTFHHQNVGDRRYGLCVNVPPGASINCLRHRLPASRGISVCPAHAEKDVFAVLEPSVQIGSTVLSCSTISHRRVGKLLRA